jgi:hypothetical protein
MLHLPTERLAALGDELPTPEEEAHLATCEVCAHERNAYRALVAMAHAEREPFGLPLTRWDAIAKELALPAPVAIERPARRSNRWMLQIAAGLLLVAGGAMVGRMSAGAGLLPTTTTVASSGSTPVLNSAQSEPQTIADSIAFGSVDEARAAQLKYEQGYQQAAAYLAQYDTAGFSGGSQVAYRSRLAALDRMLTTTSQAIREAPHDPVLNGYYLTTLGQREATLRQLNTALPASIRVNSF